MLWVLGISCLMHELMRGLILTHPYNYLSCRLGCQLFPLVFISSQRCSLILISQQKFLFFYPSLLSQLYSSLCPCHPRLLNRSCLTSVTSNPPLRDLCDKRLSCWQCAAGVSCSEGAMCAATHSHFVNVTSPSSCFLDFYAVCFCRTPEFMMWKAFETRRQLSMNQVVWSEVFRLLRKHCWDNVTSLVCASGEEIRQSVEFSHISLR